MSVHNSLTGVFSIHRGLRAGITSMAAGAAGLAPMLLEALGLLAEGQGRVLCLACDQPVPSRHAEDERQPARPFAVALALAPGKDLALEQGGLVKAAAPSESMAPGRETPAKGAAPGEGLAPGPASPAETGSPGDALPEPLAFLRFILGSERELRLTHNRHAWLVRKRP